MSLIYTPLENEACSVEVGKNIIMMLESLIHSVQGNKPQYTVGY